MAAARSRTTKTQDETPEETAPENPGLPDDVWKALAAPFPQDEIELLPKQLRKDDRERFPCEEGHANFRKASKDGIACGGFHAMSVHLHYAGHATITTRLNEAVGPENWSWEPAYMDPTPLQSKLLELAVTTGNTEMVQLLLDQTKTSGNMRGGPDGLWIRLTVMGVTRLGFGDAAGKNGPNATKELIGDALRNAAMRFGVGTYLWMKSDKAKNLKERNPEPDAPEPDPLPSAHVVQQRIDHAVSADDPSEALARLRTGWDYYGQQVLEQVMLTVDGQPVPASAVIGEHVRRLNALVAERAQAAEDTRAQDAPQDAPDGVPAASQDARADAPAQTPEEHAAEVGARLKAQGEQGNDEAQAARQERAREVEQGQPSPKDRLIARWKAEITWHCQVLEVSPQEYTESLMNERQETYFEEIPPSVIQAWVFSRRRGVHDVLIRKGQQTAADRLRASEANQPVHPPSVMEGEDAPQGA